MELKTMANRVYSLDELKEFLKGYDREALLLSLSGLHASLYQQNPRQYHNLSQVMPGICNAILMFANGANKSIDVTIFETLNVIVSSLELEEFYSETYQAHIDKRLFRLSNGHEFLHHVHFRVWWMFEWISRNFPEFEFSKICRVKLEDIFYITFGACAQGVRGDIPAFVPSSFFKGTKLSTDEVAKIVEVFHSHFTITIEKAKQETLSTLPSSKTFNDIYSVFEEKPFIEVQNAYLLLLPHKIANDFMSACSSLYVKSYSPKTNNPACDVMGKAFEEYVKQLLSKVVEGLDFEPKYKNEENEKGVDILLLKKRKIPLFVEIAKQTLFKSLMKDFSTAKYEEFLKDRIIPKFRQTFSWLKSHDYEFNGVNVLKELSRSQFILVIAEKLPLMNFDSSAQTLLSLINECWKEVTGTEGQFKRKNIYVLGVHEIERLVSVSIQSKTHPSLLLFEYSRYVSLTREFTKNTDSISVRQDFLSWLIEEYEGKRKLEINDLGYDGELLKSTTTRFKEVGVS